MSRDPSIAETSASICPRDKKSIASKCAGYVKARVHLAEIYASQDQTGDAEAPPPLSLSDFGIYFFSDFARRPRGTGGSAETGAVSLVWMEFPEFARCPRGTEGQGKTALVYRNGWESAARESRPRHPPAASFALRFRTEIFYPSRQRRAPNTTRTSRRFLFSDFSF
jgi:hypothetical protein